MLRWIDALVYWSTKNLDWGYAVEGHPCAMFSLVKGATSPLLPSHQPAGKKGGWWIGGKVTGTLPLRIY